MRKTALSRPVLFSLSKKRTPGQTTMKTKLTSHVDEYLIDRAKFFAQARGKSLPRLVSDNFSALDAIGDNLHHQPRPSWTYFATC
jgi:hypothetical protein